MNAAAALNALGSSAPLDPRIYVTGAMLARAAGDPKCEVVSLQRAAALANAGRLSHRVGESALTRGRASLAEALERPIPDQNDRIRLP